MKDYIFFLMGVSGFFVMFFGVILNKDNLMLQQIFGAIGIAMFGLVFPLDLMVEMYKEKKKKEKEED